jgi:hypothetical protein
MSAGTVPVYGATNTVLKELREVIAEVDAAIEECRRKQSAALRASTAHKQSVGRLNAAEQKRDRLASAADLLAEDWREWPWVREAGFAAKIPRVTRA